LAIKLPLPFREMDCPVSGVAQSSAVRVSRDGKGGSSYEDGPFKEDIGADCVGSEPRVTPERAFPAKG
jgi:hypothetical protein